MAEDEDGREAGAAAAAPANGPGGQPAARTGAKARRSPADPRPRAAARTGAKAGGAKAAGARAGVAKAGAAKAAGAKARSVAALAAHRAARAEAMRVLRDSVRADYEAGLKPLAKIADSVGRTASTIGRWAKECGWREPESRVLRGSAALAPAARRRLVGRLFAAFERQVGQVEARASADGRGPSEAEVKVLGALARTLEVLIELDRSARAEAAADEAAVEGRTEIDADALREEIARRLDRLGAG